MINKEIDEKLKNSFIAVKNDINYLKRGLQEHKEYEENLNKIFANSISAINKELEDLRSEIKVTRIKNYKKIIKNKDITNNREVNFKSSKGVIDSIIDIFADEDDQ